MNDAEQQWTQLRGESGFKAEELIFGDKVPEITFSAAAYLLGCSDQVSHEEVKEKSAEMQKIGAPSPVQRGSLRKRIERCQFSDQG